MQSSQTSQDYIFAISQYFVTKLRSFTKFRMLFPAKLIDLPISKVCLIGNSPIAFDFAHGH